MAEKDNANPMELVGNVAELPADIAGAVRSVVKTGLTGVINVGESTDPGGALKEALNRLDRVLAQVETEYRNVIRAATGQG